MVIYRQYTARWFPATHVLGGWPGCQLNDRDVIHSAHTATLRHALASGQQRATCHPHHVGLVMLLHV